MKNITVVNIYNGLDKISQGNYSNIDFNILILRNKRIFKDYIDILNETLKPSSEFTEYEQKRVALLKEVATDNNGNVQTKELGNGNLEYVIQNNRREEFLTRLQVIKDEYNDAILEQDEKNNSYNSFMNKEVVNLDYIKIPKTSFPENIVISDMDLIFEIIEF